MAMGRWSCDCVWALMGWVQASRLRESANGRDAQWLRDESLR